MRVRVDQLDCTGAGQCEILVPEVFVVGDDGVATVKDADGTPLPDGGGADGAAVPAGLEAQVVDAADVCPGACIYVVAQQPG
jgi:ferredoxin